MFVIVKYLRVTPQQTPPKKCGKNHNAYKASDDIGS